MHKLSTAVPQSSTLTTLCFLGLLGVLHEYACGALGVPACGSHALSSRRLQHFVTKTYAYSRLGETFQIKIELICSLPYCSLTRPMSTPKPYGRREEDTYPTVSKGGFFEEVRQL
jgi:hypothetical protein